MSAPALALVGAMLIGALIIAVSGRDPIAAYGAILRGTGLVWLLPWLDAGLRASAERNLQQTVLLTIPLILGGIAVAFPFRAGLFNIGAQGQYILGMMVAVAIGTQATPVPFPVLMILAAAGAAAAGAAWAVIAGFLRARRQAHEVISTIMLNWVAIFGARSLLEVGGPLQGANRTVPRSDQIAEAARIPAIWGDLQPVHAGLFAALAAVGLYAIVLNRTQLGFRTRVVGSNPEVARHNGISVGSTIVAAMAIGGACAGLAGGLDLLGRKFQLASTDIETTSAIAFTGIAVALLGRAHPMGIVAAAGFFGALIVGTSPRNLDATVFSPELAGNLAGILQGAVILVVGVLSAADTGGGPTMSFARLRSHLQRRPT